MSPTWISALSAFIGGRSRRIVPMPPSTSRRTRSVTAPPRWARPVSGSMPRTRWCHRCTAERTTWMETWVSVLRSAPGVTTCSPVTTSVVPASPVFTWFMWRLISLHVSWSLSRSPASSSWICHWPKRRMISTSPSVHRTKSCWSLAEKATSPSPSMFGARPRSTRTSRTRPRSGCSSAGGGKLGREVGSVMATTVSTAGGRRRVAGGAGRGRRWAGTRHGGGFSSTFRSDTRDGASVRF